MDATNMPEENDLRARVVGLEQATQTNNQRLATLEIWQRQREIESARNDERRVAMEARIDTRFSGLENSVKGIQSLLSRINWMIIAGLVAAFVAFVVGGGLKSL
ncbi:hypothetical protein [Ochrobactrum chromiisoli]|uniref:DUF1515 domain-containing protein n=1 Tax=Ochrobactrum chromiisoli TaxID=2993941 RepID=A0ABT3QUY0_9HYPH|nr:hypothetical protein [Ochrobactrum chromiisoli]MCX2699347.1 hypothetical protein [Ochrobactrum chromiisoli]